MVLQDLPRGGRSHMWWGTTKAELIAKLFVCVCVCFFFTPPRNRGGVIFDCLCVCVCVCLSICVSNFSCEQNSAERMHRFGRGFS